MKSLGKNTANFCLFLLSSFIGIGISELLARTLAPQFMHGQGLPKQALESHSLVIRPPKQSFRQRSNSGEFDVQYSINELGYRDGPITKADPQNTVIFVGDSFTEGYGVEKTKRYSEYARSPETSIVVSAIAGYDIEDYIKSLSYLRDEGIVANTIVVGLCLENDIINYEEMSKESLKSAPGIIMRSKHWLNTNSSLFNILATLTRSSRILNNAAMSLGIAADINRQGETDFDLDEIKSSSRLLSKALSFSKDVIVLIIPDRRVWARNGHESRLAVARKELLRSELIKNGLDVIDVTHEFTDSSEMPLNEYHFPIDGHWNERGHRVAGLMIKNKLSYLSSKNSKND